jgi:hypothetical protein
VELNPEYISLRKLRLDRPFDGFDSIDLRMERTPRDLPKDSALQPCEPLLFAGSKKD